MYYSRGLIRHGLKILLFYISFILGYTYDDNTSIIHRCIKNKYNNYHRIIVIKLITKNKILYIYIELKV